MQSNNYQGNRGNQPNNKSGGSPQNYNNRPAKNWADEFKVEWITQGITDATIKFTEDFGKELVQGGFTSSQFRNVYGELKRIQMKGLKDEKASFLMLKPKIAYAQGRHGDKVKKSNGIDKFKSVFDKAVEAIDIKNDDPNLKISTERFKNFMNCMEALLAYHKANEENK